MLYYVYKALGYFKITVNGEKIEQIKKNCCLEQNETEKSIGREWKIVLY